MGFCDNSHSGFRVGITKPKLCCKTQPQSVVIAASLREKLNCEDHQGFEGIPLLLRQYDKIPFFPGLNLA
jgi:hypothetical protein